MQTMTGEEQNSGDERGNHGKKRRRVDSRWESFKKCRVALCKREEIKQKDQVWTKLKRAAQERAKKTTEGKVWIKQSTAGSGTHKQNKSMSFWSHSSCHELRCCFKMVKNTKATSQQGANHGLLESTLQHQTKLHRRLLFRFGLKRRVSHRNDFLLLLKGKTLEPFGDPPFTPTQLFPINLFTCGMFQRGVFF